MQHLRTAKKQLLRAGSSAMAALLLLGSLPAAAVGDGVTAAYDEAYYAMTDYYGNLTDGSVVKSYRTNGISTVTDYGQYDEVINLSDGTAPATADGKTTFQLGQDVPSTFYFEGKTAQPFQQLPWALSVSYKLNGVATKAEDLAGKTGVVEIGIDAIPNESASEYAKNNYTLEAMAVFNQDDILSLEAPGAQVQLVGNLRAVLFIGLPGEECHYSIRVGSDSFTFGGVTFLMVPATLSQLEEIAKLSERKDDLEENYNKLSDSLDVLLDSMNGISGSLYATANGLDQLNKARETFSNGKSELYAQADTIQGDLSALQASLDTLPDHLDKASIAVDDTNKALKNLNDALDDAQDELRDIQDDMDDIQSYLNSIKRAGNATASDLESLGRMADDLSEKADGLFETLAELQLGVGTGSSGSTNYELTMQGMTMAEINDYLAQAKSLDQTYRAVGGGDALSFQEFAVAALMVQAAQSGQTLSAEAAQAQVAAMTELVEGVSTLIAGGLAADEDAALDMIAAQQGMTEADEIAQLKANYRTAKSMMDLFGSLTGAADLSGTMDEEKFFTALIYIKNGDGNMTKAAALAKKLLGLYDKTANITDSVTSLAELLGRDSGITGHTAQLLRATGNALGRLDDISDSADELLDSLDDVLDAMDDLHNVFDKNVPGLKQTLEDTKTMVTSLSQTVGDTNSFLGIFESLMKTTGTQLDSGTKATLDGLAAALRATARSLNTTGDVKDAKHNISDIIEDTWDEYTGDINNLLLMDATAAAESLTDSRNPSPDSVQVLIRTQEITLPDEAEVEDPAAEASQTTFWGRVVQMFKDIWSAITGIFKGKD